LLIARGLLFVLGVCAAIDDEKQARTLLGVGAGKVSLKASVSSTVR
jgi:hypothetical protein